MLVLVRHGQSEGNAAGLLLGRLESPLTAAGRQQAAALVSELSGADRVITSPLGRARETAAIVAPHRPAQVDERWVEVDYGVYDGTPLGQVPHEVWRQWQSDRDFRPPGGESLGELGRRVREACEELFADPAAGARSAADVMVVSHVSPIKAAVAWALGAGDELAWRLHLSTASVTRIGWGANGPLLHRYNWTPHLIEPPPR